MKTDLENIENEKVFLKKLLDYSINKTLFKINRQNGFSLNLNKEVLKTICNLKQKGVKK